MRPDDRFRNVFLQGGHFGCSLGCFQRVAHRSHGPRARSRRDLSAASTISIMHEEDIDLPKRLAVPARRALITAGFTRIDQLSGVPLSDLTVLHGVGPKALTILRKALDETDLPRME
jgi:hypothetical protein